jgi:hypothetical protein
VPKLVPILAALALAGCAATTLPGTQGTNVVTAQPENRAPAPYTITKQIRYSFTLQNKTNQLLPHAQFWTYAPVPHTSHQWLEKVSASQPFHVSRDGMGNEILHFEFENIAPYAAKIVSITADLKMADAASAMEDRPSERFLRAEPYIESDDAKLIKVARDFHDSSAVGTMKHAYTWVAGNLKTETYVPEDRGASYALVTRKGDCTEFAYLLTALGRANQVPSRPVGGYVFKGNAIVKAPDYHNWMEFYADNHWQIADAQKHVFMQGQTDYVAMRVIAVTGEEPIASQRFSYAGEGLEVVMN